MHTRPAPATALLAAILIVACQSTAAPSGSPDGSAPASQPGVSGAPTGEAAPTDAPPEQSSRQDLIAKALAAGQIDEVTSLVYRAEALFDLPELPAEFAGAPSLFEDTALFNQIVDLMPTLAPDDQARLRPFIARPTEADSIFASGGLPAVGNSSSLLAFTQPLVGVPLTAAAEECRTWVDSAAQSSHFKVWACASDDSAADQSAVASVAAFLDGLWPRMTAPIPDAMGEPLADGMGPAPGPEFGGDGRIDVYLLTLSQSVFRAGHLTKLPGGNSAAAALPSEPYNENKASGFLMVDRTRLGGNDDWHNDVIHEFFHVLQYAHNRRAWLSGSTQQWFVEASATWAETYYGNSSLVHGWFNDFQLSPLGLEAPDPPDHGYSAYIWPIFMQQETGDGAAIFRAWQAIESVGAGDFRGVSDAIDAQLKFADRFRDFAVRNLNRDILGQVTKPAAEKRYQQLDLTIPDYNPVPIDGGSIEPKAIIVNALSIPPLAARYLYFAGSELARRVTIDLAQLSPSESLDADVLVHVRDHWERRPVDGSQFNYCRDVAVDDIDQLYLILSNHSRDDDATIKGAVVTKAAEGCKGGFVTYKRTIVKSVVTDLVPCGRVTIDETHTVTISVVFDADNKGTATVSDQLNSSEVSTIIQCDTGKTSTVTATRSAHVVGTKDIFLFWSINAGVLDFNAVWQHVDGGTNVFELRCVPVSCDETITEDLTSAYISVAFKADVDPNAAVISGSKTEDASGEGFTDISIYTWTIER